MILYGAWGIWTCRLETMMVSVEKKGSKLQAAEITPPQGQARA